MTQTKTGSPFYILSLSNMLDLIRCTSVHSSSLLYFDAGNLQLTQGMVFDESDNTNSMGMLSPSEGI